MGVVMQGGVTAAMIANNVALHSAGGSAVGPAIWQGVMMILMLPFLVLYFWAWRKEPLYARNEKEKRLIRKWKHIRLYILLGYCSIGVGLFIALIHYEI